MKTILIILITISISTIDFAQSGEWINQHQTQTNYQLKQIVLLKMYTSYVSNGYKVVKTGLESIHNIKQGDFTLHRNYIASLSKVSPAIKRYSKIADIILMELSIFKRIAKAIQTFKNDTSLTVTEVKYFNNVFNNLKSACYSNIEELNNIITDAKFQMKDDERINAINRIYLDIQDKELFSISFLKTALTLSIQRKNEAKEILLSKKLNFLQ